MRQLILMIVFVFIYTGQLFAQKLKLGTPLQSKMVVQQAQPFSVWGKTTPGNWVSIKASWLTDSLIVKALADSVFFCQLKVPKARKGDYTRYELLVRTKDTSINLTDVLIGEVWLCSGQSNMEMSMRPVPPYHQGVLNNSQEIASAASDKIRLYRNEKLYDSVQRDFTKGQWTECLPEYAAMFSGVAYYFGKRMSEVLDVPIGLFQSSIGSASCQAFMSRSVLAGDPDLKRVYIDPYDKNPQDKIPVLRPMYVYNAMIHPLIPFSIKGVLWYQGESNAGEIKMYPKLMAKLIDSWRSLFKQPNMPFYYVQMTPYNWKKNDSTEFRYALFREAQAKVTTLVQNTAMVCTMDVGDPDQIHPSNKKPVGERLAMMALHNTYKRKMENPYGPVFRNMIIRNEKVIIEFEKSTVVNGLNTNDGAAPRHFYIAGADKIFYKADAFIEGSSILLSSTLVKAPVAVRYAFTNFPVTNLQNKHGLPAYPFRTDNWE